MLSVKVKVPADFSHVADDYVESMLETVAELARSELIRLAQAHLHTTRRSYVAGIQPVQINGDTATITLEGKLANMVEWGFAGGDMRPDLIDKNPKSDDSNMYAFIPFRHSAPGSLGHDTGASMPHAVHDLAQNIGPTLSIPMVGVKWGERLTNVPGVQLKKTHHATNIYENMYKMQKTYEGSTGASYMTFRTISKKNTTGWFHPGIEPRGFFDQVAEYLDEIVPAMVESSIQFG